MYIRSKFLEMQTIFNLQTPAICFKLKSITQMALKVAFDMSDGL